VKRKVYKWKNYKKNMESKLEKIEPKYGWNGWTEGFKRPGLLQVGLISFIINTISATVMGYETAAYFAEQNKTKAEIETIRFVQNPESLDPIKFVTKPGRELYYFIHNCK